VSILVLKCLDKYEMHEDLVSTAVIFHKRLNTKLWNKGNLSPLIRYTLLKIAKNFIDYIGIDQLHLQDITLSGSNAGYTYSRNSDIDLHLVVEIPEDKKILLKQLFDAKKNQYNFQHNIQIKGIDVEVYVQDSQQPHTSSGIYSVLDDRWLKIPETVEDTVDRAAVKEKYKQFVGKVRVALRSDDLDSVKEVLDSIKRLRQHGLSTGGELSAENIAFKVLRAKGHIEKLRNHISTIEAEKLSLEQQYEN
jgi:hypothetical protein